MFKQHKKKTVFTIERQIEVAGEMVPITVKMEFNNEKGTYTVTSRLTTKHFEINNDTVNDAVLDTHGKMLAEATKNMLEMRASFLKAEDSDENQLALDFEE